METNNNNDYLAIGEFVKALNDRLCLTRSGWNGGNLFVCKQVPSQIPSDIVSKLQSLPDSAKALLLNTNSSIKYNNQCLIVNLATGDVNSWVPSSSDLFATDWKVVNIDTLFKSSASDLII